eukprot:3125140-Amphidinium_carterae.2
MAETATHSSRQVPLQKVVVLHIDMLSHLQEASNQLTNLHHTAQLKPIQGWSLQLTALEPSYHAEI